MVQKNSGKVDGSTLIQVISSVVMHSFESAEY